MSAAARPTPAAQPIPDERALDRGRRIGSARYADQPYVVETNDGAWLCVMTISDGHEGAPSQRIVARRSLDRGGTWGEGVALEPTGGPEASYAVLLKAPAGRVYCFYNYNSRNIRSVPADDPPYAGGVCPRVDSLGDYVFKYSDDHGQTWSAGRQVIPVREFAIDRENSCRGAVRFFWNVGRGFSHAGTAYVPLTKVGGFGHGFFTRSEGCLLASANLLTEPDPARIVWRTLPDGDIGLRAPADGGPIAEEHNVVVLSDGAFFCVYRTVGGYPGHSYSRDEGRTWTPPAYLTYADGRRIKHPRAANFAWRLANGKYLYWFHNHGGAWYEGRNPVWLSGGEEMDTPAGRVLRWSQPEVFLYDPDLFLRISYPDLIESEGRVFITETEKAIARVHEVPPELLAGLWGQFRHPKVAPEGLVLDWLQPAVPPPVPTLPALAMRDPTRNDYGPFEPKEPWSLRPGFTLDLRLKLSSLAPDQTLLDTRTATGAGLCLRTTARGTLEVTLCDGQTRCAWDCDPDEIRMGAEQDVAIIVEGGPKLILFVVDGRLNDGGLRRQYGWGRFSPNLRHANGVRRIELAPAVLRLRIYERALRVSEAIGNQRA